MIELAKAKTKAQQIREYALANPKATPAEIAKAMGVNRQYVYTVLWKANTSTKVKKHRKVVKKLGRPRKVTEASDNLKRLVDEYKATKANWKQMGLFSSNVSALKGVAAIEPLKADPVNHPEHYKVGGIETIDFIEAKKLNYNIGNVVKYLTRADHKGNKLEDLRKAQWYLTREINALK
jgi:DNA-directed RNA polymerase specialized sigma subunit